MQSPAWGSHLQTLRISSPGESSRSTPMQILFRARPHPSFLVGGHLQPQTVPLSENRPEMFLGPNQADVRCGNDSNFLESMMPRLSMTMMLLQDSRLSLDLMLTHILSLQQCSWQRSLERHLIRRCRLGLFVRRPTISYCRLRVFPHRLLHLLGVYFPVTLFPVREVALHPLTMAG